MSLRLLTETLPLITSLLIPCLSSVALSSIYSVCEGHEHQHLVAGLLNNLKDSVQAVANVELQNLSSIRIDRTSADLQQLVDMLQAALTAVTDSPSVVTHSQLFLEEAGSTWLAAGSAGLRGLRG
jgi:hypothetical protein